MIISPNRFQNKSVLVAALNWGLGHTTRCIPIIRELMALGAKITLASDGRAAQLWREEFPNLLVLEMPAYEIRYPTSNMAWNMFWQGPKILRAIWREHQWLNKQIAKIDFDIVLSDNRFGCYHRQTKNIFLTHQLNIQTPWRWSSRLVNYLNHRMIRQYDECWVPDWEGANNLSGDLSHGLQIDATLFPEIHFIGPLSRFTSIDHTSTSFSYKGFAVLSGPEPQRTYLEKELLTAMKQREEPFLLVQGKTDQRIKRQEDNVEVISFMTTEELQSYFAKAEWVICRSGYSSIMDLAQLGKPAILIPTPGQTEQEYLAKHLSTQPQFKLMRQGAIDLTQL